MNNLHGKSKLNSLKTCNANCKNSSQIHSHQLKTSTKKFLTLFPQFFLDLFILTKYRTPKLEMQYLHGRKPLQAKLLIYISLFFQILKSLNKLSFCILWKEQFSNWLAFHEFSVSWKALISYPPPNFFVTILNPELIL